MTPAFDAEVAGALGEPFALALLDSGLLCVDGVDADGADNEGVLVEVVLVEGELLADVVAPSTLGAAFVCVPWQAAVERLMAAAASSVDAVRMFIRSPKACLLRL